LQKNLDHFPGICKIGREIRGVPVSGASGDRGRKPKSKKRRSPGAKDPAGAAEGAANDMKTTEAIQKAIELDPVLRGFGPEWLPEAAQFRIALLARRGRFDGKIEPSEIECLESLRTSPVETYGEMPEGQDPWSYLVFSDGSLYFSNNAQDEVWASVRDFIVERLLTDSGSEPGDYNPDSAEGRLIKAHL
jgi:hypothetical protein